MRKWGACKGGRFARWLFVFLVIFSTAAAAVAAGAQEMVSRSAEGSLSYQADDFGNTIPDFSRAGYQGGGVALPEVETVRVLSPSENGEDDTERVQRAIDEVTRLPFQANGFRGALLLKKGTYRIAGSLRLNRSGVVLRGEGQAEEGTIILATGKKKRRVIRIGEHFHEYEEVEGSRRALSLDKRVPWGAKEMILKSASGLKVGDEIVLEIRKSKEWVRANGMDRIKAFKKGRRVRQWNHRWYRFKFDRTITAIAGNKIELDAPVMDGIESGHGGASVFRYHGDGRRKNIGVEGVRIVSEFEAGRRNEDEAHAEVGVEVRAAKNVWIRNVTCVHLSWGVSLKSGAKKVTVQDCAFLEPSSRITGRRRYAFYTYGQYCLFQRCYAEEARHSQITGAKSRGPNVFLDCLNEKMITDSGPHHRWAVGTLWDHLKGGEFTAQDRGSLGSGHGWTGTVQVFWNCQTDEICVQKPPTGQNYAIGCRGRITEGFWPGRIRGHIESHGKPVPIRSLYLAQLADRMGPEAVKKIATPAQLDGTILARLREQLRK